MSIKKRYLALGLLGVAAVAFGLLSYSWTFTPFGRLDYGAAVSTRALSVDFRMKPDPNSNLEFTLPLNAYFAISPLLPKEEVRETRDIAIDNGGVSVPARVYWPRGSSADQTLPVVVYYHGGGFVLGSVELFDQLARSLANAAGAVVISVDYRLAPAHPFPAGLSDCYAALEWAAANAGSLGGNSAELMVAGDSAGGTLAAVVAQMARDQGGPQLVAQILYYPATDLSDARYASHENFIDGYGLSSDASRAFHEAYLGESADPRDPRVSPLYAQDFARLPPALVFTGGFDPLHDSGAAYVERLRAGGTETIWVDYPEIIHGFMSVPLFPQRRRALDATADFVRGVVAAGETAAAPAG